MSPTDAKRGAKRRKNKRGGGSSCSAVCNSGTSSGVVGSKAGVVSALGCAGAPTPAGFLAPATGGNRGSVTGINGELKINTSVTPQFTEGPVNADFTGVLQTPFTFGLNQRAPYAAGDRCLLCRCERSKDGLWPSEAGVPDHQNGASEAGQPPAALPLPMWVCSDCRRTVEKEDRHTAQEQLGSQDFLLHMPVANGTLGTDAVAATDRLSAHTPPMLPAPDLATPIPGDTACDCEACNERREISAESERESQQLQKHWSEVRYLVRCIYRQAGTPLADDRDQPLERDKDGMKELVDRLCEKDPYQLYQRLEQQAREYVLEMKARLLKHLSTSPKTSPGPAGAGTGTAAVPAAQGPPQAHQFVSLLLEEYNALCQAARTISGFLLTLENEHLQKFHVTWELHNKHLFENLVFSEPILHSSLPALVAQLRHGTTSHDSYNEDMYHTLLERYQRLEQEMASVAGQWQECEKRIDDYVDEQLLFKVEGQSFTNQRTEPHKSPVGKNTLKTKQRLLKEDWEFFKQRRYIEEQLPNNKKLSCGDNFTDTMRMLSSRLSIPDCPNCNYRRRCTCDDCSLSHILTCGIMDSPISEDLPIKLPLQGDAPPRDYLAQVHPPSLSSGSSVSGSNSSSPITVQRHPRLVLPAGDGNTFVSDDDEVPPMSAMYPVSGYRDNGVTAVNGHCGDMNGSGGVGAAQNAASPRISSSGSSSDGDDEDLGRRQETNSPPPSYNNHQQQVEQVQHACECHVCNQDPISSNILGPAGCLPPGRLQSAPPPPSMGHQFFTDTGKSTTTNPARPALHLYPHIHGHLPLHNFSRPLLHPTLYPPSPPLTHNKPLPPNLTSNHSAAKQPVFSPTLPEHVYQNSFGGDGGGGSTGGGGGGTGDWNNSLQCLSLNFESLWDAAVMKSLDQSISQVLLPDLLQGEILDPPLTDVPLPPTPAGPQADHHHLHHHHHHHPHPLLPATPAPHPSSSSSSSLSSCSSSEAREQKKSGAKKKCLYNFQDAFMETNRVALATSASTASVSCTATTVQSNDVFHSLGKEDHRQVTQAAPRSNPAALSPLPPLSAPSLPATPSAHLPAMVPPPFPKMAAPAPDLGEVHHPGLCLPPAEPAVSSSDGQLSAPPSVCSDPECEGHRCEGNRAYEHPPYDGEETQDEDSCSEHSSSTSTSTNQKEGKYCDCCYCEFFGHGGPPAAPTSRNYAEMREKLRLRLTKRKEEQPKREEQQPAPERDGPAGGVEDHRRVEDLLQFINSADSKPASSSKAAKRARHKQKKMEEKARQEAEAQQEEQRRRQEEEEAALQRELLRLQEHCSAKKKRKDKAKENTAPAPNNNNNPQPLKQTAQNVLDHLSNGKSQLLQSLICPKDLRTEPRANGQHGERGFPHLHNHDVKVKAKPAAKLAPCEHAPVKKDPEANGGVTPAETKATRARPAEAPPAPPSEPRGNDRSAGGKRQLKEDHRRSPPASNPSPSPPLHLQPHLPPPCQSEHTEQNGKPPSAESPQPKGKAKKNKKKKGDKINTSIDDVFLPKDIDLDSTEMDETEREVEYFKRFCLDSARQTRQRLSINWSNFSLKKATFAAH
ncbi:protein FAM193A isoform X2 [Hippocampus zosterae]|uniref:protein FAM193A isoform X2 n=1 Tax=Hippocampus zosterae TaxID=109293 RepID=UPI00223DA021|nr:protein FAM193A isoform X2 [Hippocampus zosterae]